MNKKIISISFFLVVILFVSVIAGTIAHYNGVVSDRNSKIALLNNQIANLNSQISNLKGQIKDLTTANIVTALGIKDIQYGLPVKPKAEFEFDGTSVKTFYYLYIWGSVSNTGVGIAYNSGLKVVAYDAQGTLEINMTVPLDGGMFGADDQTKSLLSEDYGNYPTQLVNLDSNQTVVTVISIFHEGVVTNWTVTPVWTNSP
jgi:hypothetical protein